MTEKFLSNWDRANTEPFFTRMRERIHAGPPLKQRLSNSIYRLQVVLHRIQNSTGRLEQRDKEFFEKVTQAEIAKDQDRATMYANECAEVRKMAKIMLRSQLAIEQVILRIETIRDFGEVAAQMAPVVSIVHAIKNQLMGIMPEVSYELGTIGDTLNGMIIEVGEATGGSYDMIASSEESQRILREAGTLAEQRMTEKFPDLPVGAPMAAAEKSAIVR